MTGNSRSPLCSGMGLPRSTQQNGVLNPGLWPSLGCSSTRRSHHALRSSFGSSRIVFQPFRKVSDGFGLFSDRFGPFRIVFGPFSDCFRTVSDRFRTILFLNLKFQLARAGALWANAAEMPSQVRICRGMWRIRY